MTIIYENLNADIFLDYNTYEVVQLFCDYLYNTSGYYSSKASKLASWQGNKEAILNYLTSLKLNTLSSEFIINLYSKGGFKTGECLFLNRFWVYLVENNYTNDEKIKRLITLKQRITTKANEKDVLRILTYGPFEQYLSKNPLHEPKADKLFFCTLPDIPFVDPTMKELSEEYIEHIKFNSSSTQGSRLNECFNFFVIVKNILNELTLQHLTLPKLYSSLNSISSSMNNGVTLQLSRFLLFLEEKGLIFNEDISSFLKLKAYLLVGVKKETYLELLSSSKINQYTLLPVYKKDKTYNYLAFINIECQEVFDIWLDYAKKSAYRTVGFLTVCREFDTSLQGIKLNSLSDLSFETYQTQLKYFEKYNCVNYIAPITAFYLHIALNYNNRLFENSGIDTKLLQRQRISQELLEGYEIISYNPIEPVPEADKWLLSYTGMEDTNTSIITTSSQTIDFSTIKSETYRQWFKHYVWTNNTSLYNKFKSFSTIRYFFNYITALKSGVELSIYTSKNDNEDITTNEISAYKNHILNVHENNRTRNSYIYIPRSILNHVNDNNLATFESGIFYHLSYKLSSNYDNALAIPDSELQKLSNLMKENALKSPIYAVYYSIFYIALETEFRSSQILTLTIDCVQETAKKNQYVIMSKTKVSAGSMMEQPITTYVKKHIDEIIKLTNTFRADCSITELKNYLFLVPASKSGTYKILDRDSFNKYLKLCCKELNIPEYTLSNLRDTHMTKAEEFIIRNSMSEVEQSILSGHKSSITTSKHYIDTPLRDLLESVHGVIIGNVDIKGQIIKDLPSEIATNENKVSNGCGYCNSSSCHNLTYLDCLLCNDFVTTLDRIPYFQEQIKIIDKKLETVHVQHDKEDLINVKRLLVSYLSRLLQLQEAITNNE